MDIKWNVSSLKVSLSATLATGWGHGVKDRVKELDRRGSGALEGALLPDRQPHLAAWRFQR